MIRLQDAWANLRDLIQVILIEFWQFFLGKNGLKNVQNAVLNRKEWRVIILTMLTSKLLGRTEKAIEESLWKVTDHIVHLGVESIWSEHEAVLFTDFLNALHCDAHIIHISRFQLIDQVWNQLWPFSLHITLAHECNTLKQLWLDLLLLAIDCQVNQVLLKHLECWSIDPICGITLITSNRFGFLLLILLVVSVVVLTIRFLYDVLDQNSDKLPVLFTEFIHIGDVL